VEEIKAVLEFAHKIVVNGKMYLTLAAGIPTSVLTSPAQEQAEVLAESMMILNIERRVKNELQH